MICSLDTAKEHYVNYEEVKDELQYISHLITNL